MSLSVTPMSPAELDRTTSGDPDGGVGALHTDRGNLPLDRLDVQADITGLTGRVRLTQEFVNAHDTALEATYVFPLPDRAAVTAMTMTAAGRTVAAELHERAAARQAYDQALAAGQRASIAEEERPDVFTMRVGNIPPGERVTVELRMVLPLPYEDGAATFRFPLVVAPRYVPGAPLGGPSVGDGYAQDTDATPDASRISPPVLLPGFPDPVRLSIGVTIDPAGLDLGEIRSSLHTVVREGNHLRIAPGERADRDFVLRLPYAAGGSTVICAPDGPDDETGTYQLTVLPPAEAAAPRPRDVVLLLDRSGSMGGWKMVAARRAAARIVDTLTAGDRFTVVTFDDRTEYPADLGDALVGATDRHRFRAVEHLSRVDARGGTQLLAPLRDGLRLLAGDDAGKPERDRVLVLVTDGQVGNEDQLLGTITPLIGPTRIHAVGIDRAVNAGFLGRLAALGAGRCELVESEDRLDEAMEHIHRRIGAPVVTGLAITATGLTPTDGTRTPARLPGIFPGVPLVVHGRYTGPPTGALTVRGSTRDGREWTTTVPVHRRDEPAVTALWARAHLRDIEDAYLAGDFGLERRIVDTSLRHGVLCRFTAYVAVDTRQVTDGSSPHRVVQPVQPPSGWDMSTVGVTAMAGWAGPTAGGSVGGPRAIAFSASYSPQVGGGQAVSRMSRGSRPGRMPAAVRRPGGGTPGPDQLRAILATEADRLRAAADRPAYERQELLADLASRLGALLGSTTDPAYQPVRELIERLRTDGDLETMWRAARQVLDGFATGTGTVPPERGGDFWKR